MSLLLNCVLFSFGVILGTRERQMRYPALLGVLVFSTALVSAGLATLCK